MAIGGLHSQEPARRVVAPLSRLYNLQKMAIITNAYMLDLLLLFVSIVFLVYRYLSNTFGYFRVRGIPSLSPTASLKILDNSQTMVARNLYDVFPEEKFFGYFILKDPYLMVKDPSLIQRILVKDFSHFEDHGFSIIDSDVLFSKMMFHLKGQTWRTLRYKFSPTFSSGKRKLMFEQLLLSGDHLLNNIEKEPENTFDAKQISADFAVEVIASAAFGLDLSKENPQTDEYIQRVTTVLRGGLRQNIAIYTNMFFPKLASMLKLSFLTPGSAEYFYNLIKATKDYRLKNNVKRHDFFDLLLELQKAEEEGKIVVTPPSAVEDEDDAYINQIEYVPEKSYEFKTDKKLLTDEVMAAQAFGFLLGGSDSVSGTLMFALYHIAKDQEIQKRMAEEVDKILAKHGGCTYQAVREMAYMDQVLQETMRMYPNVPVTLRECSLPYRIPDTDIVLEKGAKVNISVAGLHWDPKYYPEPHIFDPERFVDNNYKPSPTYLPFGDGPRICIGMRFAIVEMKVYLTKLLSRYSLRVNSKTQEPLALDKKSFTPVPVGKLWIDFKQRT